MDSEQWCKKPDLRSKGSRFGVKTGNSLKWSLQDHHARRYGGLIRKECIREGSDAKLFNDDGMEYGVEYSINRKQRWYLAEALESTAGEEVKEFTERIYERKQLSKKGQLGQPFYKLNFRHRPKSDEYLYDVQPDLNESDPDVVAVVMNFLPHPRLRRRNASRISTTFEKHRAVRTCVCKGCKDRFNQRRHRLSKSYVRTACWHMPPSRLRRDGPLKTLKRLSHVVDLYEICQPLPCQFPMHHEFHNPTSPHRQSRIGKIKDMVKLASLDFR